MKLYIDGVSYPQKSKGLQHMHLRMSRAMPGQWLIPSIALQAGRSYCSLVNYYAGNDYVLYQEMWYADERIVSADFTGKTVALTRYTPKTRGQSAKIAAMNTFPVRPERLPSSGYNYLSWEGRTKSIVFRYGRQTVRAKDSITLHLCKATGQAMPWALIDGGVVELLGLGRRPKLWRQAVVVPVSKYRWRHPTALEAQRPLLFGGPQCTAFEPSHLDELDPLTGQRWLV